MNSYNKYNKKYRKKHMVKVLLRMPSPFSKQHTWQYVWIEKSKRSLN